MQTKLSLHRGIVLGILFLLIASASNAQITMDEFMAKWERSRQFTLETLDKMPDNLLDYKPHTTAMSFKEHITHLAASIAGLSKGFLQGGEMAFDADAKPQSKSDLKKFIEQSYSYGKETILSLTDAQMDEEIDSFAGRVTRRQMVGLIDDHATHHRGAAIAYLRANGIVPPPFRGL